MSSRPALSVIIPCLDEERHIAEQLKALLRQEWSKPWELIVSDNGSTDGTLGIVERYGDRLPLRIVDSSDRPGAAHARNVGARAAEARALAFCDADDEVGDGWLSTVGASLERHDLVLCRADGTFLNPPWLQTSRDTGDELSRLSFPPFLCVGGAGAMGVRAAVHEALGGFDETLAALEDNDYCIRAQLVGIELVYLRDTIIHYRYRTGLSAIYRQASIYSRERSCLQKRYAESGWNSSPWKWPFRGWRPILRALPNLGTRSGRARFAWLVGWQVGRIRGSLRYRVFAV